MSSFLSPFSPFFVSGDEPSLHPGKRGGGGASVRGRVWGRTVAPPRRAGWGPGRILGTGGWGRMFTPPWRMGSGRTRPPPPRSPEWSAGSSPAAPRPNRPPPPRSPGWSGDSSPAAPRPSRLAPTPLAGVERRFVPRRASPTLAPPPPRSPGWSDGSSLAPAIARALRPHRPRFLPLPHLTPNRAPVILAKRPDIGAELEDRLHAVDIGQIIQKPKRHVGRRHL